MVKKNKKRKIPKKIMFFQQQTEYFLGVIKPGIVITLSEFLLFTYLATALKLRFQPDSTQEL